jgi:hypothetical protein
MDGTPPQNVTCHVFLAVVVLGFRGERGWLSRDGCMVSDPAKLRHLAIQH